MLDNLRRVFVKTRGKVSEGASEEVEKDLLLTNIAEDEYFDDPDAATDVICRGLAEIVRVTVDGESENLDGVLFRVKNNWKAEFITWDQFLGFFCKRGQLRDGEKIVFESKKEDQDFARETGPDIADLLSEGDADPEDLRAEYQKNLTAKQVDKQNKVPIDGKGKYNVTVPVPFEFMRNQSAEKKTIRQQWLEGEVERREQELQKTMNTQHKAKPIPKTTTQPLYGKILAKDAARRQKAKEASLARNRTLAKPFSFHERDLQKAAEKLNACDDIDDSMLHQFRARNVPWRILIPRFRLMVERDEHEREQRIIRNAEASYKMAKLPPRMQAYEDERKRKEIEREDSDYENSQMSTQPMFDFKPPRARSVPDFHRLQKQFVTRME